MAESNLVLYQRKWAQEKYLVMAHSQAHYNALRLLFKGNAWSAEKESEFDQLLREAYEKTPTIKTLRTTYQHIWGYFKKVASSQEKETYKILEQNLEDDYLKLHTFLMDLTHKYQHPYLLNSFIMQRETLV